MKTKEKKRQKAALCSVGLLVRALASLLVFSADLLVRSSATLLEYSVGLLVRACVDLAVPTLLC